MRIPTLQTSFAAYQFSKIIVRALWQISSFWEVFRASLEQAVYNRTVFFVLKLPLYCIFRIGEVNDCEKIMLRGWGYFINNSNT